ncbi:2-oxoglutarate dehydrogenase E1 component, partial [Salinicoccus siamensis]
MRFLFENLGSGGAVADSSGTDHKKVKNLLHLIDNIRLFGHLKSEIYPVYDPDIKNVPSLDFKDYDLTEEDLKNMPATVVSEYLSDDNDNAYEALMQLHDLYTGPIAYEYMHVNDT